MLFLDGQLEVSASVLSSYETRVSSHLQAWKTRKSRRTAPSVLRSTREKGDVTE